jgi:hypothetical protein
VVEGHQARALLGDVVRLEEEEACAEERAHARVAPGVAVQAVRGKLGRRLEVDELFWVVEGWRGGGVAEEGGEAAAERGRA